MSKGGYGAVAVRWLSLKNEKKKIYGIEKRTKSMNYYKTVKLKSAPQAPYNYILISIDYLNCLVI